MGYKSKDIIETLIEENISITKSIAHYEDTKILIDGGYEGQIAHVRINKKRRERWEGRFISASSSSPAEIKPCCQHFGVCGGCSALDLAYEKQIEIKLRMAKRILQQIANDIEVEGIIPSPIAFEYRNKMEFSFGDFERGGPLALGLHAKGRRFDIVPIRECALCPKDFAKTITGIEDFFQQKKSMPYRVMQRDGWLRHLVVRRSYAFNEMLIGLVATGSESLDIGQFVATLLELKLKSKITGILYQENNSFSDAVNKQSWKTLYGAPYIREKINGIQYEASMDAFLQTNTMASEKLYDKVIEYCGDLSGKSVLDLYCGIGTISIALAKRSKYVLGAELVESAVESARRNAEANQAENVEFIQSDVGLLLKEHIGSFDIIVVDPPRSGLGESVSEAVAKLNASAIVYVSCKLSTLASDIQTLMRNGYKAQKACVVDMFPHTEHVETVVLLYKL